MPESNIVYRQSAQVISSITDLSQIDTTPDYAFFACVTGSKGKLNSPYLIPEGNLTLLENYFGEVSAKHTTLLAAARAVREGCAAYLVRVAGKSVASSSLTEQDADGTEQVKFSIKEPGTDGDNFSLSISEHVEEIPESTQEAQVRGQGPAGDDNPNFDYPASYTKAGVTYSGNIIRYIPKDPAQIDPELFHDAYAFIGLTFPKPAGATKATIYINGSQALVDADLTQDSDDVIGGNPVVYFAFADAAGIPMADSTWEMQFNWTTPSGVVNTYMTIYRRSGEEVKKYDLTLYRDNLVMEELVVSTTEGDDFILDAWSDYFDIEAVGDVVGTELAIGTFKFTGGNDGVSDITYQDFVGEKTPGGYTGVYCFMDNRLAGQFIGSMGYTAKEYAIAMKEVADARKDLTVIVDPPSGLTFNQVRNWINSEGPYAGDLMVRGFNMETYWDWEKDEWDGVEVVIPPSSYVIENSLRSFRDNNTWYPVAGDERGVISATGVVTKIDEVTDRDTLVTNKINPIHDTGIRGIQIYGNETLNEEYSDLSAAHIARTLTYIRSTVDNYTETLKFELNDDILWSTWVDYVENKILEPIKTGRGLQWYQATMGEAITTREELAQRKVRGRVELQFTPDAEIFILDYVVYASSEVMTEE